MILLDTHVLLEMTGNQSDTGVGPVAVSTVDAAWSQREVAVSAISFWEIGMLVEKEKIRLSRPIGSIRESLLIRGLMEIPVDGDIAVRAAFLKDFHRDPADRIIVSTALNGHRLLTRDAQILAWSGPLDCQDVRR